MKVKENFLEKEDFIKIKKLFFEEEFPWYYRDQCVEEPHDETGFYFTHSFVRNNKINSDFYDPEILPLIEKLKAKDILEVRANLMMRRNDKYLTGFHIDTQKKMNTAIYYINENNGNTTFGNNIEITPKENKMLIFPSHMHHANYMQTDIKRRIVINFNYL
tara:strand:+ start:2041 stop:2523 length:483 start_codon:yes stop_codon:yes gene_type:complete